MSKIKHQQLPAYRSIYSITQSNLAAVEKNGKKIAISGKFGIDTTELVSVLESQGYEVLDKLSKDCDFVLIGFDDYKTLFKAKKYLVRQIDFLDLIKILTNKNYQIK